MTRFVLKLFQKNYKQFINTENNHKKLFKKIKQYIIT